MSFGAAIALVQKSLATDTLQQAGVEFTVCTWGDPNMDIGENQANLTGSGFLDYFYGFVSAK